MMADVSPITFESLYDLVRKEKTNDEIQKLSPHTYTQIVDYLKTKIEIYKNSATNMAPEELEKLKTQIVSARKLVKEFYERRERKIIQLAINKSRTKSELVEDSMLLEEEKPLFEQITTILNKYRSDILLNLVNAKHPSSQAEKKEEEKPAEEKKADNVMIRFMASVPKFLGEELEVYGPFEEGDIANLPRIIADVLIQRERAEEIKPKY